MKYYKIEELTADSKNIRTRVTVLEKKKEWEVKTRKKTHRGAHFVISDDTGTFLFTVWDDEIDKIPIKSTIIINKAYVSKMEGEMSLHYGRFGRWEVVPLQK